MTTAIVAALIGALVLAFVEAMARFYPARSTWLRMRRVNGIDAVRAMRQRLEAAAEGKTGRRVATVLTMLVIAWVASASLLDKRWYEVVADVLPYVFVIVALYRLPSALRTVASRMEEFERDEGDVDEGGGPSALAL